jgi:hypothetical protein
MWSGIVSAWPTDCARVLEVAAGEALEALEAEGIDPMLGKAEANGQGKDRDRLADPELKGWPLAWGSSALLSRRGCPCPLFRGRPRHILTQPEHEPCTRAPRDVMEGRQCP